MFFFTDTATTEIYTSCHPLSLHDALLISHRPAHAADRGCRVRRGGGRRLLPGRIGHDDRQPDRFRPPSDRRRSPHHRFRRTAQPVPATRRRSEEHTSELQSLMRNSYAVFCLKKTNKDNTITTL